MCKFDPSCLNIRKIHLSNRYKIPDKTRISIALVCLEWSFYCPLHNHTKWYFVHPYSPVFWRKYQLRYTRTHSSFFKKKIVLFRSRTILCPAPWFIQIYFVFLHTWHFYSMFWSQLAMNSGQKSQTFYSTKAKWCCKIFKFRSENIMLCVFPDNYLLIWYFVSITTLSSSNNCVIILH